MTNDNPFPAESSLEPQPPLGGPPAEPTTLTKVFIGNDGLRAGWKALLFVALTIVLTATLRPLFRWLPHIDVRVISAKPVAALDALRFLITILVTLFMVRLIDRKPWGRYGLPWKPAFRAEFWTGTAIGFGVLALQLVLMRACGWFEFGPRQLHGAEMFRMGAWWGLAFLLVGLFEEFQLRGYLVRVLADGMGFWLAAVLTSALFAAGHLFNPGENAFGITMVFLDGLLMCFTLQRTGNLWFAIGQHGAWDWAQTFFFGVPNSGTMPAGALRAPTFHGPDLLSGGTAGPEGSILVLFSLALTAVLVAAIYRKPPVAVSPELQQPGAAQVES